MRSSLKVLLGVAGLALAAQAGAQVTFYEGEGYLGRFLTADGAIPDLSLYQFDDRATSASVANGRWEACSKPEFQGRCVVLEPGSYPSLASIQMMRSVASVRPVAEARVGYQAPAPVVASVNPADQVFAARVTSVRPISGAPAERCWMERQQVGPVELPGVLLNGMGDLLAGKPQTTPYVQRCEKVAGATAYWDVTYEFQGIEHHVQLSAPPGSTIAVNGFGQPRG
ncbi:MAG TPA: beta/gamma crystallin-related protein [Casimicrobiaceae bacterium]|nr:beta/gamma crystallin-related protein [Casimicrobiaceae bacterium]